jgi:hypothetical protein
MAREASGVTPCGGKICNGTLHYDYNRNIVTAVQEELMCDEKLLELAGEGGMVATEVATCF